MAGLLWENTALETLRLYDNGIGDKGCLWISRALKVNTRLKELNLRSNQISYHGLRVLAKKLHHNNTLVRVDVGYNGSTKPKYFPTRLEVQLTPSPTR